MTQPFTVYPILGIPEIVPGDDLGKIIFDSIMRGPGLESSDIVVVTSKIVSKAENQIVPSATRDHVIDQESVRVIAERGKTKIVETKHGLIMAAAGVDASNAPKGTVLILPKDSDASARGIRASLHNHAKPIGVIISDTMGRAWRLGLTDNAIGVAGVVTLLDYRGQKDSVGRTLEQTITAVVDQIASAAELVKGKLDGIPVVLLRGLGRYVTEEDGGGARSLVRPLEEDMFSLGSELAEKRGYERGVRDGRLAAD
jgi:coenzyme F420-0:L-glutamate ligase/coenzyme F420-1:gamma-L-glutamate ligase